MYIDHSGRGIAFSGRDWRWSSLHDRLAKQPALPQADELWTLEPAERLGLEYTVRPHGRPRVWPS